MERFNGGSQRPSSTITFHSSPSPFLPLPPKPLHSPRRLLLDTELSIFDAQRYFNESTPPHHTLHSIKNPVLSTHSPDSSFVSTFTRNYRNNSFNGTPTASSEASWNSQSGLLHKIALASASVKKIPSNEPQKPAPFSPRRRFRRPCPCSGKKCIDVEEKCTSFKSTIPVKNIPPPYAPSLESPATTPEADMKMQILAGNWAKEREILHPSETRLPLSEAFSFPILKPPVSSSNMVEDPARQSLEVFKPNRRAHAFFGSPRGEDDVGSDASSDLFELESFSDYKRSDSLGETTPAAARIAQIRRNIESSAAAAELGELYAPSEVSVAWSVTTAEGFDRASAANFSSAASDYGMRVIEPDRTGEKRKGTGLLSCVCEKAVSVGPVPVRLEPEQPRGCGPVEVDRVHGISTLLRANGGLVRSNSARTRRAMVSR